MIFFSSTYQALFKMIAPSKVKRYIIKTELNFTAQKPAGAKLRVYNSYKELVARADNDGKSKFVDVKKYANILAQLEPSTLNILMTANNHLDYLQKNRFNLALFVDGKRYVTTYDPAIMRFITMHTSNTKVYENYKQLAKLEAEANAFIKQANDNAVMLQKLLKFSKSADQKAKLQEEIVKHRFAIESFKMSLPPDIKVQVREVQLSNVQENVAIGVFPVIIIIVVAIVAGAGVAAYTLPKITQIIADVARHRNNLLAQQANIRKMIEVAGSNLPPADKERITKEIQKGNAAAQEDNKNIQENSNKGFFDDAKKILLWGGGIYVAAKILPSLFNNKSNGKK